MTSTNAELLESLGIEARGRVINPNLIYLRRCFFDDNLDGCILEGSSRSGKTWSSVDFIIWLCTKVEKNCTINIVKETYASFKTTLYEDFKRRLPMYGIRSPFDDERLEVKTFYIFGNKITFIGADQGNTTNGKTSTSHGVGCDYLYFNEMLDISEMSYNQYTQRCRKFWWGDYNPKAAVHWVYNRITKRKDVGFLVTTFLNNPYISALEKKKILSYEPTHPDDRHLELDLRRPHPTNIEEGTADDYHWNVYGLGLRSSPEGLIFRSVKWVKEFPTEIEKLFFGMDFGYENDPTCLVKGGMMITPKRPRLYLQSLFYEPTPSYNDLAPVLNTHLGKRNRCWADPSGEWGGRGYISSAQQDGFRVHSADTGPGTIMYGISILKCFEICLVESDEVLAEQGNYKYREIQGIRVDEPVDAYNHFWDASRMIALSELEVYVQKALKEQGKGR